VRLATVPSTRRLASAPLEVVSDRRARAALRSALVVVLVGLAIVAGARLYAEAQAPTSRIRALQDDNAALQAEIVRLETELELERATRAALDREVAGLNEQLGDLSNQLTFFNAQSGRSRSDRSSN
jgi:septal ring factor EnvC (AmiA/AmiB activator)